MTETLPGPTLGVVGGGQLGRMLAEAAAPLGVELVVLDPTPDCPAATVAADQVVGDFDDEAAVRELAERADVLTVEIELADPDLLAAVREEYDVPVHASPEALRITRDKLREKIVLDDAGIPVPSFHRIDDADDFHDAVDAFGQVMLKARRGGYDGRGNLPVESVDDADDALAEVGTPALAESFVEYERELAVMGVNGADETRVYPVTETIHEAEILRETVVPARTSDAVRRRAHEVARDVLDLLDGRGVYGIELFETTEGEVLVNEIAPRPHNSGHWTIEGAARSQFESHVRAVLGWPLGEPARPVGGDAELHVVTANVLGDVDEPRPAELSGIEPVLAAPGAHLHWYGKREARPLRKMGHLTVRASVDELAGDADEPADDGTDDALESLLAETRRLRDGLTFTDAGEPATDSTHPRNDD